MLAGHVDIGTHRRLLQRLQAAAEIAVDCRPRAGRLLAVEIFAAQQAGGQRRIGEQADILVVRQLRHVEVIMAIEQIVFVLHGGDTRQAARFGQRDEFLGAPGRLVGQPDGADLAGLHAVVQRLELLVHVGERPLAVLAKRVVAPGLAEVEMAAVRPVDLVEIDIVGLQALQAGIDRLADRRAGDRLALADIGPAGAGDLGGKHHVLALAGLGEPVADDRLGERIGLRRKRRGRVEFGGVEEIDAVFDGIVHLLEGFGPGVLRTPGHGAEADFGDGYAGAAECIVLHEGDPSWRTGKAGGSARI